MRTRRSWKNQKRLFTQLFGPSSPPLSEDKMKDRVVITKPIMGVCYMQVCAVKDATDQEILDYCNTHNRSGTQNGWTRVIRTVEDDNGQTEFLPVVCNNDRNRQHLILVC